eukprot:1193060-Prorocentrum_minimum.AAC.1
MAPKTTTPCRDGWRSPDRWRCRRSRAETGGAEDDPAQRQVALKTIPRRGGAHPTGGTEDDPAQRQVALKTIPCRDGWRSPDRWR